jgi:predicted metal-binding membrane protein
VADHRSGSAYAPGATPPAWPRGSAVVLAGTLGLAGACWGVAAWQMDGMDMGTATQLGSFGFFAALWIAMMAAMMLPGAAPAVLRRARAAGARAVPVFVGSYVAVWALAGLGVYAVYRPHGLTAAGALVTGAGIYELTPVKRYFRQRCLGSSSSGVGFGLCCVGSTIGLMLIWLALGAMSLAWMSVVAVVVLGQKLWPANLAIDVPLALAIVGLGIWIIVAQAAPL